MYIRENRGITLTTLVVTVVVLLILAGVATSTGIEAIENTKHTKFVAELKIMQSFVNQWYEDCKPSSNETFEGNIANKFTAINAQNATEDTQAQTTLTNANVLSAEFSNYYILDEDQKNALGVEGVSQKVLVSVKNRKVVSYDGLKWKNKMYYTIDDQSGEGLGEIYNVEYQNPNTNAPTIEVTGKSVYYGDTAKNAKYRFTVNVTQGSSYINKGDLYYGKKENGNVRNWQKTANNTLLVDREGTYQFYYKDAAGNVSNVEEYVIEPKATLIDGPSFNIKMKELSGTAAPASNTKNTNITAFKISETKPSNSILVDNNKVSTNVSQYPVYMWFDNGNIWIWSEENWIEVNTDASYMFNNLQSITNIQLSYFLDTSIVTDMSYLFHNCISLNTIDVSNFNTFNVTTMNNMFSGSLTKVADFDTNIDYRMNLLQINGLNNLKTSKVTDMSFMFYMCVHIKTLDVSSFDTQQVTTMEAMFGGCWSVGQVHMELTEIIGLENFNTLNVETMKQMFYICSSLKKLDLSNFNTSKVTNMGHMFTCCSQLTSLNVSNFNTERVTSMNAMFASCSSITQLDLSSFNTSIVENMSTMFSNCSNLTTIYVSDLFVTDNVTSSTQMFIYASKLVGEKGTKYKGANIDKIYARIDDPTNNNPGYFTRKNNI